MKKYAEGGAAQGIPAHPVPKRRSAGAGRGFVNPQRVDQSDEDYVTPKQRYEMEKQLADTREAEATKAAYNKASGMKKGGYVKAADGCAARGKTKGRMI